MYTELIHSLSQELEYIESMIRENDFKNNQTVEFAEFECMVYDLEDELQNLLEIAQKEHSIAANDKHLLQSIQSKLVKIKEEYGIVSFEEESTNS